MSMTAPSYYSNEEYLKWYDFDKDKFKDGAPKELVEMVEKEDAERQKQYDEAMKNGILL